MTPDIIAYYAGLGRMTDPGAEAALLAEAPRDLPGIAAYVQNLLLHQHWAPAYRMRLSEAQIAQTHTRSLADMLALLHRLDGRPLAQVRTLYQRMVGNCRHFSLFGVALLRRAGIPARARCGFATYFDASMAADHWVVEFRDGVAWRLADLQLDAAQCAMLRLDFDPLDVPRDRFLVAGDAWTQCRDGRADPQRFGIFDMHGLWFIAGNVLRDFAALNGMEMLPWDVWGPMPRDDAGLTPDLLALFDRLASMTLAPDANFAVLRALYDSDEILRVPDQVFNALRQREETI